MKKTEFRYVGTLLILIITLIFSARSWGQTQQQNEFWQHLRFGGGIGLSFGDEFFSGTLAPSAIYQFNPQFAAGIALNGTYSSLKNTYNSTILGGSVLALYNVIPEIQLSAEFEELYVTRNYQYDGLNSREIYWYPAMFMGIGFHSRNVTVGIRYDVLYNGERSIYANAYAPFVRIYF